MKNTNLFGYLKARKNYTGNYRIFRREDRAISIIAENRDDALRQLNEHVRVLRNIMPEISVSDLRIK